jgi:hypothetical protein
VGILRCDHVDIQQKGISPKTTIGQLGQAGVLPRTAWRHQSRTALIATVGAQIQQKSRFQPVGLLPAGAIQRKARTTPASCGTDLIQDYSMVGFTARRLVGSLWIRWVAVGQPAAAQQVQQANPSISATLPNILEIMSDDVDDWNVGSYCQGMIVPTPNIDRIAKEGLLFTNHYSQPTRKPSRAAFITGQLASRTGLTTVAMPGSPIGLDKRDPTPAEVLKTRGDITGQFGKNHLWDRNEHQPTGHRFNAFYGNLHHLNARGAGTRGLAKGYRLQSALSAPRPA